MNEIEVDFYKNHSSEWVFDTPFVDTIMCSHCNFQFCCAEFASRFCPDCGYLMKNYDDFFDEDGNWVGEE